MYWCPLEYVVKCLNYFNDFKACQNWIISENVGRSFSFHFVPDTCLTWTWFVAMYAWHKWYTMNVKWGGLEITSKLKSILLTYGKTYCLNILPQLRFLKILCGFISWGGFKREGCLHWGYKSSADRISWIRSHSLRINYYVSSCMQNTAWMVNLLVHFQLWPFEEAKDPQPSWEIATEKIIWITEQNGCGLESGSMCDDNMLTLMKDCPFSENITNINLIYVITLTLVLRKWRRGHYVNIAFWWCKMISLII